MNPKERMQEAYDRIATDYIAQYSEVAPVVVDWGLRFLSRVGQGARVLDVGCGPGQYMAWMESRGMTVVGVDLSAGMLAEARSRVRGDLLQMDMRRLAFVDGYFDGIWCVASLLHLPKNEASKALTEMWRVLVPGGALLLTIQEGEGEAWEESRYFGAVQRFFARYNESEAEKLLVAAGFDVADRGHNESPLRSWLQFLALKPPNQGANRMAPD